MGTEVTLGARYRLERQISTGGMGEVWAAQDERLGRRVAVKLLREDLAAEPGFKERFRAEARAVAALAHPNVVAVYDYGEHDGVAYLAMELVDGEPLSSILRRRGSLGIDEAMSVVAQTAGALSAAHAQGLVHRDVKPANILVRPDGRLAVTDFGIARSITTATRTEAGTVLGTVAYMSPEQVRGEKVTQASDVYSLGVVAFECLSGRRPFTGDEPITVALAHLHDPAPPLLPAVPAGVRRLVAAMLAKEPGGRPPSARAVAVAARGLMGAGPQTGAGGAIAGAALDGTRRAAEADHSPDSLGGGATALMDMTLPVTALGPAIPAPMVAKEPMVGKEQPPAERARRRTNRRRAGAGLAAGLVALVIVLVVVVSAGGGATPKVTVPKVTGRSLASAEQRLAAIGLVARTTTTDSPAPAGDAVLSQRPGPGGHVRRGTRVTLTVPSGFVTLPAGSLVGMAQATAVARLEHLGLADAVQDVPSSATTGDVVAFTPSGRLAQGTTVTVTVASAIEPTPTTAPAPATPATPAPTGPGHGGGPQGHDH